MLASLSSFTYRLFSISLYIQKQPELSANPGKSPLGANHLKFLNHRGHRVYTLTIIRLEVGFGLTNPRPF